MIKAHPTRIGWQGKQARGAVEGFAELVRRGRRSRRHPAQVTVLHALAAVLLSLAS